MLGFDALGRLALGQAASGPGTAAATLVVSVGTYTIAGKPIAENLTLPAAAGAYALAGLPITFRMNFAMPVIPYTLQVQDVSLRFLEVTSYRGRLYLRGNSTRRTSLWKGRTR